MEKNFVLTAAEFRRIPGRLKKILKKTRKLAPSVRASMIQSYLGISIDESEVGYDFNVLLGILRARARVFCPYCQKKVSRKSVLGKGLKKVKNCLYCKGSGSLTGVEIEKMKRELINEGGEKWQKLLEKI